MKKILLIITILFSLNISVHAAWSIFWTNTTDIIYCTWKQCSLENWTKVVKSWIDWIEKNRTASVYIMAVIKYLITFISLLAVIYIIYAWFRILTWAWEEDQVKKSKQTILWVMIWIVIIWLAYSIVLWIMQVVTTQWG